MTENDRMLKGFCKVCIMALRYSEEGNYPICWPDKGGNEQCQFEPVLSPKQMKIILNHVELGQFHYTYNKETYGQQIYNGDALALFLERYPFLVAKILKESGEKK